MGEYSCNFAEERKREIDLAAEVTGWKGRGARRRIHNFEALCRRLVGAGIHETKGGELTVGRKEGKVLGSNACARARIQRRPRPEDERYKQGIAKCCVIRVGVLGL